MARCALQRNATLCALCDRDCRHALEPWNATVSPASPARTTTHASLWLFTSTHPTVEAAATSPMTLRCCCLAG